MTTLRCMRLTRLTGCLIPALTALSLAFGPQTTAPVVSGIVRDDAGAALAGAMVTATRVDPIAAIFPVIVSRTTDSSGRYAFDSLDRGNYVFGVTVTSDAAPIPQGAPTLAPGARIRSGTSGGVTIVDRDGRTFAMINGPVPPAEGSLTLYAPAFHGGARLLTRARLVQVDPDRSRADVDIVVSRKPAVRVAGVLTVALPQNATESGAPYRLVVRLLPADTPVMPPRGAAADAPPIATALADDAGAFVFPAVPAGEYVIDTYRAMPPPSVSVSPKGLPVFRSSDRVDGDPQGLAAAQAIALERDVDDLRMTLRGFGPASRAAIEARAARGARGGPPSVPFGRAGGTGAGAGRALPGGPRGGGAIVGRLTDAGGAPLAGVQIFAAQVAGSDLLVTGTAAITDADGRYRLGGLARDSYTVVVPAFVTGIRTFDMVANAFPATTRSAEGKTGYVTTFYPATADASRATVVEISGQDRDGIDIALQRVRVTDLTGTISGGSAGELVTLLQDDRRAQLGGRNVGRMRLLPGGEFSFRDVPDGRYTLKYSSLRGWVRAAVTLPGTSNAGPLRLSPEPHVSISGRVMLDERAAASGAPLPAGLTVEIRPDQPTFGDAFSPGIVQADGTFTVPRVIPGQRYIMRVVTTPPWRQIAGTIQGQDAFAAALTLTASATDARVVITNR